jgi:hypothetical protein
MASHGVLVQNKVSAQDMVSLNRSAISGSDIDNGFVFYMSGQTNQTGAAEVWDVFQPTTGSIGGLWMAAAPELSVTTSGNNKWRGLDPDPRNFYTAASTVFDAFKLMPGDIVTLTTENLDSATPQAFAKAGVTSYKFAWASALDAATTTSLRYLSTTYISVGSGSAIGTSRVPAFKFEVVFG